MNPKIFLFSFSFSFYLILNFYLISIFAIEWNEYENWANGCDFKGNDLSVNFVQNPTDCGKLCVNESECTHYVWSTIYFIGICKIKTGPISKNDAITTNDKKMVCGLVSNSLPISVAGLARKLIEILK